MLKLTSFVEIELTDETFTRPQNFCAEDKIGAAWRMEPEGREYHIELEFTPKVACNVSEVLWHPSQKCRPLPKGGCVMTFTVDGLGEIAWWICGYADQVKVIQPAELRNRVEEMHTAALKQYEPTPPPRVVTQVKQPGDIFQPQSGRIDK